MANEKNLKPCEYQFTDDDRRKATRVRQENLKKKQTFREIFDALLSETYDTEAGTVTGKELAAMQVIKQVLEDGNLEAFKIARDTIGEKPVDKVMVADVDPDVISEVEQAVLGDKSNGNDTDAGSYIPKE